VSSSRNLIFVTGTRADYGKLEPLAIAAVEQGHRVTFFVTGMHMMARYGLTKTEVHLSGRFEVVEFINQRVDDPQDIVLAKTVVGFSDCMKELDPDLVVIHGDRVEALACSLVCSMNYIPCAHVEGGEVSGTIDEVFRHCNTKLSSVHLVSSELAKQRVLRLGEVAESVHVIGSPELDIHSQCSGVSLTDVLERYEIHSDAYGIAVFHPVTSESDSMGKQAESIFEALERSGKYYVVILPNNDPGSSDINRVIEGLPRGQFRVLPSMRFSYFSELMKNAKLIVGNSSIGVREAPFLGVPSIDLGTRQSNRAQSPSVHHCEPFDQANLLRLIHSQWGNCFESHAGFGTGNAAQSFVKLLNMPEFWDFPLQKYFADESDSETTSKTHRVGARPSWFKGIAG